MVHLNFTRRHARYSSVVECGGVEDVRRYPPIDQVRGSPVGMRRCPAISWQPCHRAFDRNFDCWRRDIDFADKIECSARGRTRQSYQQDRPMGIAFSFAAHEFKAAERLRTSCQSSRRYPTGSTCSPMRFMNREIRRQSSNISERFKGSELISTHLHYNSVNRVALLLLALDGCKSDQGIGGPSQQAGSASEHRGSCPPRRCDGPLVAGELRPLALSSTTASVPKQQAEEW